MTEKEKDERREKRARSIAAMGLVKRDGDKFIVSTPSLRGRQTSYKVWRDATDSKVMCNCLEFEEEFAKDKHFRCEHILAVRNFLIDKGTDTPKAKPQYTLDLSGNKFYSDLHIDYFDGNAIHKGAIIVSRNVPNQEETAMKIIELLNGGLIK